jgi:hypothetical protein
MRAILSPSGRATLRTSLKALAQAAPWPSPRWSKPSGPSPKDVELTPRRMNR